MQCLLAVAVLGAQFGPAGGGDHHLVDDQRPEFLHQVQREGGPAVLLGVQQADGGVKPGRAQRGHGLAEDDRVPVGQRGVDDVLRAAGGSARRSVMPSGMTWPRAVKYARAAAPSMPISSSRVPQSGSMTSSWSICPTASV